MKNGGLYIFGNLFNKAIAFITVPIFTRILSTAEYGIVSTYSSWVSLLAVVVGLSLSNSIRNAYVDFRDEIGNYISSVFTLAIFNLMVIICLLLLVKNHIEIPDAMIWLCLIESFFNFVINTVVFKYVMEEEALKRTLLLVFPNLTGAIISVCFIFMLPHDKYYGRIIGTCVATASFGGSLLIYYLIRYKTFYNKRFWKYALPISIPLIFHGISCNILGASDRTIITYFKGASETGIYSLIYNYGMVSSVLTASAESVWIPIMTRLLLKKNNHVYNRYVSIYIYIVLFAFCGLLTISPEAILFFGGKEYLAGWNMVFPVIASIFVTFIYGIYVNIEYYYKKTKIIAASTIIAAIVNIILNIIFVPLYGAVAAAYTTLFSHFLSLMLHARSARKINPNIAPYNIMVLPCLIFILAGIITNATFYNIILRFTVMIVLGIIYCLITYKFLISKNEWIKKKN